MLLFLAQVPATRQRVIVEEVEEEFRYLCLTQVVGMGAIGGELVWLEDDVVPTDHTHPSDSGQVKVTKLLLDFLHDKPLSQKQACTLASLRARMLGFKIAFV